MNAVGACARNAPYAHTRFVFLRTAIGCSRTQTRRDSGRVRRRAKAHAVDTTSGSRARTFSATFNYVHGATHPVLSRAADCRDHPLGNKLITSMNHNAAQHRPRCALSMSRRRAQLPPSRGRVNVDRALAHHEVPGTVRTCAFRAARGIRAGLSKPSASQTP